MTGVDENIELLTKRKTVSVTENDLDLLHGLAEGKGFSQISARLNVSRAALAKRAQRLFARIGVHNSAHAVSWAYKNGLLE